MVDVEKFSLYSKLVLVILTLYRRVKLLDHLLINLDGSRVTFKYFAFLSFCDTFELLGHVQAAMMI